MQNIIKKIVEYIKKNKVIAIGSLLGVLLIGLLVISYFVVEHNRFTHLNSAMEEVYITPYDENNLLIRGATLENMETEIIEHIEEFSTWYEDNIGLSDENITKRDNIINNEKLEPEIKLSKTKEVYLSDIQTKNDSLYKTINEKLESGLKYSTNEKKQISKYKANLSELSKTNDLKTELSRYSDLVKLKRKVISYNEDVKDRIAKDKKEEAEKKAKEAAEKEAQEDTITGTVEDIVNSNLPNDGAYNRALAQDLFNSINSYRASLGLSPYSYNSSKQSCIDAEASAYANTSNPHNWVCDVANENASIASIGSDAVGIAMNFFVNDPPHEAVLSGNYSSCAVSIVEQNGMYYMIVGVF